MRSARRVGRVFFPLDEELALLPSSFSPCIHQCIVRLGTLLPFDQVPEQLAALTGVTVSRETVRRLTEQAGAAQVAVERKVLILWCEQHRRFHHRKLQLFGSKYCSKTECVRKRHLDSL